VLEHAEMRKLSLGFASFVAGISTLLANGGAWQTGVPGIGSAGATNQNHKTDVTTEDETLKIDLHPEYAEVQVRHGVDLVVGSHPHCVQSLDFYHGCPIAYSLGNLVFDGAPTVKSWNRGALLQIGLDANAQASYACLIPIVLEDGFPRLDAPLREKTFSSHSLEDDGRKPCAFTSCHRARPA
jgi:Bacterial capsule synthesis protein PGA_cap